MKSTFLPASSNNGKPNHSKTAEGSVLGILLSLCLLFDSGLFQSCCPADPFSTSPAVSTTFFIPQIQVATKAGWSGIKHLDIFVFDDDEYMRLDSYCSIESPSTSVFTVNSGAGDKFMVVLANYPSECLTVPDFCTYDALDNVRCNIRDEDPEYPTMSGECHFCAGVDGYNPVQMTPLLSNICVDFVSCNFSGRGYRSKTLENASVYLTNISASSEVLRQDGFHITELENSGYLDERFLDRMSHPEMIKRSIVPGQWSPVNLYCYPNDDADGMLGSPHTRLVLQGDIDGTTYYYPIEINQVGFGYNTGAAGISRNIKYSYSFNITRKGSTDPDTLVEPEEIVEKGWIKLYPGNLITGTNEETVHIWCETYPENCAVDICKDDLDYDVERGIYEYEMDADGHGVTLTLKENGTGMFTIDAGPPINDGFLVIVVVNP